MLQPIKLKSAFILAAVALFMTPGCSSTYYAAMEKFGIDKRDILVDRVEEARDQQEDARDQFRSTLDAFRDLTDFDGGDLEDQYDVLKSRYDDSVDEAEEVSNRIEKIEDVGADLFEEWRNEAEEIGDSELRRESRELLRDTERRYDDMLAAMHRAEAKMAPVLARFKDHVLFLKHNLNARAIGSLETQLDGVRNDVDALIDDMELSIAEADAFISDMTP